MRLWSIEHVMKFWFLLTIEMYAESTALEQFNMTLITFLHIQDMTSIIFCVILDISKTQAYIIRICIYIYINIKCSSYNFRPQKYLFNVETLFIVFFGNWIHHCWSINFILSSYFAYRNKNMERRLYSKEWTAGLLQSIYKVRSQQAVVELPPWSRLFTDRQLTCSRMSSHRMVSSLGPNAARRVADTLI